MAGTIPNQLTIKGVPWSVESLAKSDRDRIADPFTQSISEFCKEWISGKMEFTLRTSGSTGKPKEIVISRKQIIASSKMTLEYFDLRPGDRILLCMNPEYIGGKMMLARALVGDLQLIAIEPSSNPMSAVEETDISFTAMVPFQLAHALRETPHKTNILNAMKSLILGGAPVSAELLEEIQQLETPVYLTYGMTETVSHIALRRLNGHLASDHYTTLGDVKIDVDSRRRLMIKSAVTGGRWITTNDRVDLIDERRFNWLGRADRVINSGGIKFQIEELERKIEQLLIRENLSLRFFIYAVPDNQLGEKIGLAVESAGIDERRLKRLFEDSLTRYEKPREIKRFPSFIETPSGKIDRKKTLQHFIQA